MDAEKQQKVVEFCSISGADPERAEFFLQAAGWDTGVAMSTFFENDSEPVAQEASVDSDGDDVRPQPESAPPVAPQSGAGPSTGRIQTFAHWNSAKQKDNDDDEDEDQGQAYYAGGSDTSGQQILGPPRKNDGGNVVKELFKAAKQHGAEVHSESDASKKPQRTHFAGTGYRLGESEAEVSHSVRGAAAKKEPLTVTLRLWRAGFTVNDEPLRPFQEPQNRQFLECIHRGEIPQELLDLAEGGQVALDMEDHSSEDYVPPKHPKVKAFTGSGQTLGSESSLPSTSSAATSAQLVTVDTLLPVTNIQIRLADGSRLVAKFNHTHTVGDVRRHIAASRPQYAGVGFSLIATLPSRQLTDDSVTLKDADLLNAAVMQKL